MEQAFATFRERGIELERGKRVGRETRRGLEESICQWRLVEKGERRRERERLTSSFSDCTERHPGHKKRVKKRNIAGQHQHNRTLSPHIDESQSLFLSGQHIRGIITRLIIANSPLRSLWPGSNRLETKRSWRGNLLPWQLFNWSVPSSAERAFTRVSTGCATCSGGAA